MAIHVEVQAYLDRQQIQREADKLAADFENKGADSGARWGAAFGTKAADEIARSSPKVQQAFNRLANSTDSANAAFRNYMKVMSSASASHDQVAAASERLNRARRAEADAHRAASAALRTGMSAVRDAGDEMDSLVPKIQKLADSMLNTGRAFSILGPAAIPVIGFLYETAQVAVTASQSIALLPAAAVAAGAGLGTLKLATQGFSQTITDMGDVQKFHDDLIKLAPNAQNAALAIRSLVPQLTALQQATQNDFFAGFSDKIQQLSATFLPTVQNLTTSIATSMNQSITGVADMLMTPQNQGNVATVANNIASAFQNAAPAAKLFAQALVDITTVGSSFLPGLGDSITNVAAEFSNFISQARQSGELKKWISEGIDAAKQLAGAIMDIGKFVYQVFGGVGQGEISAWRNQIQLTLTTFATLLWPINEAFKAMNSNIPVINESLSNLLSPLKMIQDVVNSMRWFFDPNYRARESAMGGAVDKLNEARIKKGLPPVTLDPNTMAVTPGATPPSGPGTGGGLGLPLPHGSGAGSSLGWSQPAYTWGNPPPAGAAGSKPPKPSDKDRRDAIKAGLDPSLYKVDPFAPLPGMPNPYAPPPGAVQGVVDPQAVFEAQQQVISQAHTLEEDRKNRLAIERDNQHTAEDISDAKWKEVEDGTALQKAQANLADKQRGTAQALKSSTEALSAGLDPDLGLSKGLSGFVDNLVRFAGHMALAGPMAQMNQTVNANAAATGITGGYGLLGIAGAQNLSQGKSPLLGNPMPADTTGAGTSTTPPTLGSTVGGIATGTTRGGAVGAPLPGESARDFAHRVMMPYWQSQGLTVGDHAADKYGEHQNGALDLMVNNLDQGNQVLQQVLSDPNVYGAIFNNQTYGYGHGTTPQDYSAGHTGDPSTDHTNHVHAFYKPGGANNITPLPPGSIDPAAAGSASGYSSAGFGGLPIPLPVTIVGAGGGGGLPGPGGGAPGGAAGQPPMPTGGGAPNTPQGIASMIYQQAIGRGYSPHDAQSIVAYAIGESSLNPGVSGGVQGGAEVQGLFQEKGAFAQGGGIDPSQRTDPVANTYAYLNQLEKNRHLPIEQALPATSVGGPLASGAGAQPQAWGPLMQQAQGYLSGGTSGPGIVSGGAGASSSPGWGGSGWSGGIPATGGGQAGGPGPSMDVGTGLGSVPPTQYGGVEPPSNPGGGGMGITPGGTIDSAMQMAASAFPGVGQAAATGMKLANRAIQYGGQMAGIGVEGLMQTFLPTGGSELASNSWLTRIVGGLAGASPALPNLAGKQTAAAQQQAQAPLTPQQVTSGGTPGVGAALGAPITINYANNGATEDRAAADIAHHLAQQNQPNAIAGHR